MYPDAETALRYWFEQIGKQDWQSPNEVISAFKGADTVGNGRIVFNIGGNKYRLVAAFDYEFKVCWIKFTGTHKSYHKTDVKAIQL